MSQSTIIRSEGRSVNQMREISFERGFQKYAEGSCLVSFGQTKVICSASIDDRVPPFLIGSGQGWITAEYAMLPKSTKKRTPRERASSGRSQEIQRLIGRSLRSVNDLTKLGERTIYLDCDVLQADGGTRTASITGCTVALYDALQFMLKNRLIDSFPMSELVGAVSVGIVEGCVCLDLDYSEDSVADVDFNVVKTESGQFVELQGSAEHNTFNAKELNELLSVADDGIRTIIKAQRDLLGIDG